MGTEVFQFLTPFTLVSFQPRSWDALPFFLQHSPCPPPCCVSKALGLSKQTFYTIAASAIISSSQCLYHLFGIYHALPIILAYFFTGIFCHPYQEDCKHNHTKAYIHTDIIYTDIS